MRNMLVTGGAGFIGSNFIRYLLKADQNVLVYNLDALTYDECTANLWGLALHDRYRFILGNITDASLVRDICRRHRIDTIVHFAAESHVDRSISDPEIFLNSNVIGTFVLLEAARIHGIRFHHVSTDEVYGSLEPDQEAWTEDAKYGPRSPYSASKASSDHFVRAYGNTYGLRYTITNCSNNYGPYQFRDKLIPLTIHRARNLEPVLIHGNGMQIRDWLHVEDHCEAIYAVLLNGVIGETYNVGGDNQWTVLDIVREICGIMDELKPIDRPYSTLIRHVEDRTGQDRRYALNTKKLECLGWRQKHEVISSLKETVRWYLNNG
jgi:dTDP-glucose 4,6-dehydratase